MPIFRRSLIILAKLETTYGVDSVPTGAANAVRAINAKISPMEGQDLSRNLDLPTMGNQASLPADLHMKLEFQVEMQASGTAGTAPAWAPLIRACGCAQTVVAATSVTYNPVSDGFEAATLYFQLGGTLYAMRGARGNAKIMVSAQGIPMVEFAFSGLFQVASEAVRPTPVYTAWLDPLLATNTNTPVFTVNGVSLKLRDFSFDMGNTVEPRLLIGGESIQIVDRAEMIEARVEAEPLTTLNPYALAIAQTRVPVVLQHGTVAGRRVTLNAPLSLVQRTTGLEESQGIVEWPLRLAPQINAGNDQFTLVCT